eukprot:Rmarinus@m.20095
MNFPSRYLVSGRFSSGLIRCFSANLKRGKEDLLKENEELKREIQLLKKHQHSLEQLNRNQVSGLESSFQSSFPAKPKGILGDPKPRFWLLNDVEGFVRRAPTEPEILVSDDVGWKKEEELQEIFDSMVPDKFQTGYGSNPWKEDVLLVGNSKLGALDIPDLLELAKDSSNGKVPLEIEASRLNAEALDMVASRICLEDLYPLYHDRFSLKATNLVIYQAGRHSAVPHHTVCNDGKVIYFLNSDYEGGIMRSEHDSRFHPAWKDEYVAMNRDCGYYSDPVRTGYKVVLMFDIYYDGERPLHELPVPAGWAKELRRGIDSALEKNDIVAICLKDLYRSSQIDRAMLTSDDQRLWDVVCEYYELAVVPAFFRVNSDSMTDFDGDSNLCPLYTFSSDSGAAVYPNGVLDTTDYPGEFLYMKGSKHTVDHIAHLVSCLCVAKMPAPEQ